MEISNDNANVPSYTDIDAREKYTDIYCTEYASEIFAYLRQREKKPSLMLKPYMMIKQDDINHLMREIVVGWLVAVAEEYKLASDSLYLTVYIMDRYLYEKRVTRDKLQLVGIACMYIATKVEEVHYPSVDEFIYLCDNTYTKEQVFQTENDVVHALGWDYSYPTAKLFMRRFCKAAGHETGKVAYLACYIAELSLVNYQVMITYLPSTIAAASIYLSLITLGEPWTDTLTHYTEYSLQNTKFRDCIQSLHTLHVNAKNNKHNEDIIEKYSHRIFLHVANFPVIDTPIPQISDIEMSEEVERLSLMDVL